MECYLEVVSVRGHSSQSQDQFKLKAGKKRHFQTVTESSGKDLKQEDRDSREKA